MTDAKGENRVDVSVGVVDVSVGVADAEFFRIVASVIDALADANH